MQKLLAKSAVTNISENNLERCTLIFHLRLTFVAAKKVAEITGKRQIEAIGLDPERYYDRYRKILLLAAIIHDLGKANSHFYGMIKNECNFQTIRHEWVLYLLLRFSSLGEWLKKAFSVETREEDFTFLVWAVTGHHRKKEGEESYNIGMDMKLLIDPAEYDFFDILNWITHVDELDLPPIDFTFSDLFDAPVKKYGSLRDLIALPGNRLKENEIFKCLTNNAEPSENDEFSKDLSFMAAIRSSLMVADASASAMGEGVTGDDVEAKLSEWISDHLNNLPLADSFKKIVDSKLSELKNNSQDKLALSRQKFQEETASSKNRVTLCIAGCGSGKTLAAWKWAHSNCQAAGNRLFFCYPTTGTTTEGYMDYLLHQELKKGLIHSRAGVDDQLIDRLREAKEKIKKERNNFFAPAIIDDVDSVMRSLELWQSSIACCTVDTVLKMLNGSYSGHLIWPVLAQSSFIFDEIHSYDNKLFERLIQFLENIKGVKVLLMTASLPEDRLSRLCKAVKKSIIDGVHEQIKIIEGPKEWETVLRYQQLKTDQDPVDLVIEEYQKGKKILWICNTVDRALKVREKVIARLKKTDFYDNLSDSIIVYHSRFKYEDRIVQHEACINAFKNEGPALCIATQVAEMSLDISADFLVTDSAPIPALIQRLGRLNRWALRDDPWPFLIIDPIDDQGKPFIRPYSSSDDQWINVTSKWLDLLGEGPLSQKDLTEEWKKIGKTGLEKNQTRDNDLTWNEPGPWMQESNLREASSGCNVVLAEDVQKIKFGGQTEFIKKVIPMPALYKKTDNVEEWSKYKCYVARNGVSIEYNEKCGGKWIKEKDKEESPDGIKETLIF